MECVELVEELRDPDHEILRQRADTGRVVLSDRLRL